VGLSLSLFAIGVLGFTLNRKNVILMLLAIEVMLLGATLLFAFSALSFGDALGQGSALFLVAVAGAESAIGLGILVAFFRLRGSIAVH
jgi:NADH-ubiquinone oxidoreductase chain 4L